MEKERIQYLLQGYMENKLDPSEKEELSLFFQEPGNRDLFIETINAFSDDQMAVEGFDTGLATILERTLKVDRPLSNIPMTSHHEEAITMEETGPQLRPVPRTTFLQNWRWVAAAAIIIVMGTVAYLLTTYTDAEPPIVTVDKPSQSDIAPGGNRAVLTLANGSTIVLDSALNGTLAVQGNAQIVKLANGQIAYNLKGASAGDVLMNTMTTPRGGQYQLALPDGSRVWLNAASSITYPAIFTGKERKVQVTGEAYFEVAKNKEQPFLVEVDGRMTVQVLGTHFNINSYGDDAGSIKTTLLEGSVKVIAAQQNISRTISPGQQAAVFSGSGKSSRIMVQTAEIDKVMAWKNGLFNFEGASLDEVMKQLERWYDLRVAYEKGVPQIQFFGKMSRSVSLAGLLKALEVSEVNFRIEKDRTLVVTP